MQLSIYDIDALCKGAQLLGSGGGGDTAILKNYLHYLLDKNGGIEIISPEELNSQCLVVPIAEIGAPLIGMEKVPNSLLFYSLIDAVRQQHPGRRLVLMPAEIGGSNALTPFVAASLNQLPVLDADLIGRAFPRLSMCKPAVTNQPVGTTYISNYNGECVMFDAIDCAAVEQQAREIVTQFGCSAGIVTYTFDVSEMDHYLIKHSISHALNLGRMGTEGEDIQSYGTGLITEVSHAIQNGFLNGHVVVTTPTGKLAVYFQNEYLHVTDGEKSLIETPDIIALLDQRSGLPISSESLRYGLAVEVVRLPAPAFWTQSIAHQQVCLSEFKKCA